MVRVEGALIWEEYVSVSPVKHVVSAVTLMKISATYKGFKKHLDRVLPIPKAQLALALDDLEDDDE